MERTITNELAFVDLEMLAVWQEREQQPYAAPASGVAGGMSVVRDVEPEVSAGLGVAGDDVEDPRPDQVGERPSGDDLDEAPEQEEPDVGVADPSSRLPAARVLMQDSLYERMGVEARVVRGFVHPGEGQRIRKACLMAQDLTDRRSILVGQIAEVPRQGRVEIHPSFGDELEDA
jgi:hypothetical protein